MIRNHGSTFHILISLAQSSVPRCIVRAAALLVTGLLLLHALSASALAFTYDESVDGDLPNYAFDVAAFPLDFGTNTFSGIQHYVYAGSPGADYFDSFQFTIPSGGYLVSVTVDVELLSEGSGLFSSTNSQLQDAPFHGLNGVPATSVPIPSSGLILFSGQLPLSAGTYAVGDVGHLGALSPEDFRAATYTNPK
jgi:hypothetical protein